MNLPQTTRTQSPDPPRHKHIPLIFSSALLLNDNATHNDRPLWEHSFAQNFVVDPWYHIDRRAPVLFWAAFRHVCPLTKVHGPQFIEVNCRTEALVPLNGYASYQLSQGKLWVIFVKVDPVVMPATSITRASWGLPHRGYGYGSHGPEVSGSSSVWMTCWQPRQKRVRAVFTYCFSGKQKMAGVITRLLPVQPAHKAWGVLGAQTQPIWPSDPQTR